MTSARRKIYKIKDFIFNVDQLVHMEIKEGDRRDPGNFAIELIFTERLDPDRAINTGRGSKTARIWFDTMEELQEEFFRLEGVRKGAERSGG